MFVNKLRGVGRRLGQSSKTRTLRVESLETRELLSVTPSNLLFKDVAFTITGGFSATTKAAGHTIALSGNTSTTGDIQYTSPTAGSGHISVTGNITKPAAAQQSFAFAPDGGNPISDANGKFTGSLTLTDPTGNPGPYTSTGAFSPKTFVASVKVASLTVGEFTLKNAAWAGKIVQTDTTPFSVTISGASYSAGTLTVPVTVPGQAGKAASEGAAAATITLSYADANKKPVGKAPNPKVDTIKIYWNEASGTYAVTGLTPPTSATQIVLKIKIGTRLQTPPTYVPITMAASSGSASAALAGVAQSSQKKDSGLTNKAADQVLATYA